MLRLDAQALDELECEYPGIRDQILKIEEAILLGCPHCDSIDTAQVFCGVIGRTLKIVAATTKATLVANASEGSYFCNSCRKFFGMK